MADLYDDDIVLWSERQAEALRRRSVNEIDWDNVAEEIESLGRSERSRLASHIRTVLEHLMRLQASPATEPRPGWRTTVARVRIEIARVLAENPSLVPTVPTVVAAEVPIARELTVLTLAEYGETPRVSLDQLSYTADQVTGRWFPDA